MGLLLEETTGVNPLGRAEHTTHRQAHVVQHHQLFGLEGASPLFTWIFPTSAGHHKSKRIQQLLQHGQHCDSRVV